MAYSLVAEVARVHFPPLPKAKESVQNSDGFSPSPHKVVGNKKGARPDNLRDLAPPLSRKKHSYTSHAIYG